MNQQKPLLLRKISLRRGFSLVLVVTSLVLMTILAVSFLLGTSTELASARMYAEGLASKRYSDLAINVALAQITAATAEGNSSNPVAWASQPGLIRTWDNDGNASKVYKLYSSPQMVESASAFDPQSETSSLSNWKVGAPNKPFNALWCDLNSPIDSSSGRIYPIMPPMASNDNSAGLPLNTVEGFSILNPPGFTGGTPSESNNPAPMPVRWLYVLKDGSLEPAASGNTAQVSISGATASNPIVARVAFWVDDESAKVNVNTAAERHFWDTPITDGKRERDLAINNPVRGEFQRTPGHPFTVSLSQALGKYKNGTPADYQAIYALTPRASWGGSENGEKPFKPPIFLPYNNDPVDGLPGDWATRAANMKPMPFKVERLYASVDEMVFKPERQTNFTPNEVRRLKFFNTTASRSPETTLFNTPRVSMWPITWPNKALLDAGNLDAISLAPEERLLAFAARINNKPYYYQRYDSKSTTNDFKEIPRNKEIMQYLVGLGKKKVPGFGGTFEDKWGNDLVQNHVNAFDYLRSGLNLNNRAAVNTAGLPSPYHYAGKNNRQENEPGGGMVVPIKVSMEGVDAKSMGNFPVITEVAMVVYAAERRNPNPSSPDPNTTYFINYGTLPSQYPKGSQTTKVGSFLMFEFANSMSGYIGRRSEFAIVVKGNPFSIDGSSLGFPDTGGMTVFAPLIVNSGGFLHSPISTFMGTSWLMGAGRDNGAGGFGSNSGNLTDSAKQLSDAKQDSGKYSLPKIPRTTYDRKRFPLHGNIVSVNPNNLSFQFTGTNIEVEIWSVDSTKAQRPLKEKVQTYKINLSELSGHYPMPIIPAYAQTNGPADTNHGPGAWRTYGNTLNTNGTEVTMPNLPAGSIGSRDNLLQEFYNPNRYYYNANQPAYSEDLKDMRSLQQRMHATIRGERLLEPYIPNTGTLTPSGNDQIVVARNYVNENVDFFADTMFSVQLNPGGTTGGDIRLLQGREEVPDWFTIHPAAAAIRKMVPNEVSIDRTTKKLGAGLRFLGNPDTNGGLVKGETLIDTDMGTVGYANIKPVVSGRTSSNPVIGDWNNAYGSQPDGAVIPKPQDTFLTLSADPIDGKVRVPFFSEYEGLLTGTSSYFSPARQIAGPVALGVLPSGLQRGRAWEQLLFNPNPRQGPSHPGFNNPPDHLFLDLFWMPVVEPYAISEPLSTAGKINLNQQIVPFGYVERYTGLYALLQHMKITAIPKNRASNYKNADANYGGQYSNKTNNDGDVRREINVEETVNQFYRRLKEEGKPFKSASELTEIWMIPSNQSNLSSTQSFWSGNGNINPVLTGANSRQQPYNHLYSLVTTKSNSYTIHWRVQVLEKATSTSPGTWVESVDRVRAEYRGSTLVERYIDPNDTTVPDYATENNPRPIHEFYKWRIVSNTQFNP